MPKCYFHSDKESSHRCSQCEAQVCEACWVPQWRCCRDCLEAGDLRNYALWRTTAPVLVKGAFVFAGIFAMAFFWAFSEARDSTALLVSVIAAVLVMGLFNWWSWQNSTRRLTSSMASDVCTAGWPLVCGRSLKEGQCRIHGRR